MDLGCQLEEKICTNLGNQLRLVFVGVLGLGAHSLCIYGSETQAEDKE